jgi:hypothetical protein
MRKNPVDLFKQGITNAVSKLPEINAEIIRGANRIKNSFTEEKISGGLADNKTLNQIAKKHNKKGNHHIDDMISLLKKQLKIGIKVEMEHTNDKGKAREIAMDHLWEDPKYYTKLKKIETKEATTTASSGAYSQPLFSNNFIKRSNSETKKLKEDVDKIESNEATTSASSGSYETPAAWAKTTSKKDWGPSRKPQIPGGSFVSVKKRCKKFPYCNQGDIKALKIYENKKLTESIKRIANKFNIDETTIKAILEYEFEKTNKLRYL